ncbi:unnamed protein product [Plutella xylostella]|uniref:(diamondback moth) hypothetical protein n=1 Tax=Plutella xylostella TaxID=51655 RepID=A0A8S4CZ56_PLUXY|nr:unnamed protein product [Plutella xylostella]
MNCLVVLLCLVAAGAAQPLVCIDDAQCAHGTFCFQHQECRRCLQCAELSRAPRAVPANCTMSVVDCGPCLPGLVPDPSGNLDASCVAAAAGAGAGGADPPPYLWIGLGALAVLLATCLLALVYVVRHTDSVKILSNISLWLPCSQARDASPTDAPPPYNAAHYSPVRPTSPPLDPLPTYQPHAPESLDSGFTTPPFDATMYPRESKATATAGAGRGGVLRDAAQAAVAYHHPRVRFPDQAHDEDEDEEPPQPDLHDQDTAQSTWTPADDSNNNHTNSGPLPSEPGSAAELSTLLSEARGLTVIRPPDRQPVVRQNATDRQAVVRQNASERRSDADDATPSKVPCVRQDSNHNHRGFVPSDEAGASGAGQSSAQPSLGINIYVQHNDVKIFK